MLSSLEICSCSAGLKQKYDKESGTGLHIAILEPNEQIATLLIYCIEAERHTGVVYASIKELLRDQTSTYSLLIAEPGIPLNLDTIRYQFAVFRYLRWRKHVQTSILSAYEQDIAIARKENIPALLKPFRVQRLHDVLAAMAR